jgi:hypothetical protein
LKKAVLRNYFEIDYNIIGFLVWYGLKLSIINLKKSLNLFIMIFINIFKDQYIIKFRSEN